MLNRIAAALAAAALLVSILAYTKPAPSNGAGLVQAAKQYLQDIAKQNSLKIDGMKVIAVRETGDEGIVRVEVTYHPYLQLSKTQTLKGPEATITLAVHLHRSNWNAGYANG